MRKNFRISLYHVLIISFVSQILIAVGLTSYFSWKNGRKTVEALALRLSREITSHTKQHIDDYLNTPTLFLNTNRIFADSGRLDVKDITKLQPILWQQAQIDPQIDTIYFGSETGDFIEIEMKDPPIVAIRNSTTAPYWETYRLDSNGQKTQKIGQKKYDPRQRPWYKKAMEEKKLVWSPIYLFADPPVLGITPAIPLVDPNTNEPLGVMAIDLTLSDISQFLSSLKISDSGRVFIVEKSGEIIATSTNKPSILRDGNKRLNYKNSQDDLVRNTAEFLNHEFKQLRDIHPQEQLIIKHNGDRYFVQTENLVNQPGLDWVIVTVIPESDFIEHIRANVYTTLVLGSLAAVSAICLGAIASQWIVKSVNNLSKVAQTVAKGEMYEIKNQSQIKELAIFTQCFNFLISQVESSESRCKAEIATQTKLLQEVNQNLRRLANIDSLTQIYNRYYFDTVLPQIWHQAVREQQEISLILCDVDYFKSYNDTYGHPAGDRCLQQVAQAIKNSLNRSQDIVARYGGEEFAVILPNTKLSGAVDVAQRIRNAVSDLAIPHRTSEIKDHVTISCGVVSFLPTTKSEPIDSIESVDRALYKAKLQGRDCVATGNVGINSNNLI